MSRSGWELDMLLCSDYLIRLSKSTSKTTQRSCLVLKLKLWPMWTRRVREALILWVAQWSQRTLKWLRDWNILRIYWLICWILITNKNLAQALKVLKQTQCQILNHNLAESRLTLWQQEQIKVLRILLTKWINFLQLTEWALTLVLKLIKLHKVSIQMKMATICSDISSVIDKNSLKIMNFFNKLKVLARKNII